MELSHGEIERLYDNPSVRAYRPEAVLAALDDGSLVPALCFNLADPPAPGERNPQYAAKLRDLARRLGLSFPRSLLDQNGNWIRGEIFAGSRHIATYLDGTSGTTYFDYSDWLGTERLTATVNGYEQDACTLLPFGDDLSCTGPGADPSPLHFTGQQHDTETGLDHFPARDYASVWGTFRSGSMAMRRL